eukprot:3755680-Pleurochrysis_carterae.AAC.1
MALAADPGGPGTSLCAECSGHSLMISECAEADLVAAINSTNSPVRPTNMCSSTPSVDADIEPRGSALESESSQPCYSTKST